MEHTTQSTTTPERSEPSHTIATSALHRVSEAPTVMKDSWANPMPNAIEKNTAVRGHLEQDRRSEDGSVMR